MADGLFGTGARVGPINQTAIQPTAIPGSTFVRAPVRERGSNLTALASALSGFNSALQNFASVQRQQEEDPQSRANKEWVARRQQMSLDDLINEVQNETHDGIRIRQDAVELLLAERANNDLRQQWLEFYNTDFDHTTGDAAAEYERMRQEFAARLPSDVSRGHLYRLSGQHFQSWMEQDVSTKAEYARGEMHTTIVGSFRNAIDDARAEGITDPVEIAQRVFAKSSGNRVFLGLTGQEQNETIFNLAQELALNGDYDLVKALLEGERVGADGRKIGSLKSTQKYAVNSIKLLEQARNQRAAVARRERFPDRLAVERDAQNGTLTDEDADSPEVQALFTDAERENLAQTSFAARVRAQAAEAKELKAFEARQEHYRQLDDIRSQSVRSILTIGGVNDLKDVEIPNESGSGSVTITGQRAFDMGMEYIEDELRAKQQELIDGGMPADDAKRAIDRERITIWSNTAQPNRLWQNVLNGMSFRVTPDSLPKDGGPLPDFYRQSAALYRQIKEVNPSYLAMLLTDSKSKTFFDRCEHNVKWRGFSDEEAMRDAAFILSSPITVQMKNGLKAADRDKAISNVLSGMGTFFGGGNNPAKDTAINREFVRQHVDHLGTTIGNRSSIEKTVMEELANTTFTVNGVLVSAVQSTTPDFAELLHDELEARFEQYGEDYGIGSAADLIVLADGTENQWIVYDKTNMRPVGAAPITLKTIDGHRQRRVQEADARVEALRKATAEDAAKAREAYEEGIRREEARIAYWRKKADARVGMADMGYAKMVADDLQRRLDERLARDEFLISTAPKIRGDVEDSNRKARIKEQNAYRRLTPKEQLAEQDRRRAENLGLGQRFDTIQP